MNTEHDENKTLAYQNPEFRDFVAVHAMKSVILAAPHAYTQTANAMPLARISYAIADAMLEVKKT